MLICPLVGSLRTPDNNTSGSVSRICNSVDDTLEVLALLHICWTVPGCYNKHIQVYNVHREVLFNMKICK